MDKLIGMLIVAAIFVPIERTFTLHPAPLLRLGWKSDVVHFVFSHFLSEVTSVIPIGLAIAFTRPLLNEDLVASQPGVLQIAEMFAVVELTGYWAHRAMHQIPFLWRIHRVHHSSRHLDWLAAARVHPLDQQLGRTLGFIALYLLGFGPRLLAGGFVLIAVWAIFLHANVRIRFPRLRQLVATPEFHHWHHSNDLDGRDCNFAGLFPFIDRLFGTLHLPAHWPKTYGVDEHVPEGYLAQLAHPFRASRPQWSTDHLSTSRPPAQ